MKRYVLLMKQCVQLAGYNTEENQDEQLIAMVFSHDDQHKIADAAKALRSLHSNVKLIIYDSSTGNRINVK